LAYTIVDVNDPVADKVIETLSDIEGVLAVRVLS
jgi:hypothetical protein